VQNSFAGKFRLADAGAVLTRARDRQRPREVAVIREAAEIANAAKSAFEDAWNGGADIEHAALAGERMARQMAAHDIRTLVSRDNGRTLQPYRARFDDRPDHLVGYIAVKYLGYWADSFVQIGAPASLSAASAAALQSLLEGIGEGKDFATLAAEARGKLSAFQPHTALQGDFGGRIGLSVRESEGIRSNAKGGPNTGTVYSLRAGVLDPQAGGSIASAMIATKRGGGIDVLVSCGLD